MERIIYSLITFFSTLFVFTPYASTGDFQTIDTTIRTAAEVPEAGMVLELAKVVIAGLCAWFTSVSVHWLQKKLIKR